MTTCSLNDAMFNRQAVSTGSMIALCYFQGDKPMNQKSTGRFGSNPGMSMTIAWVQNSAHPWR
jgi:hypothetical protein